MALTMTLGGVDLGTNFPLYGQAFSYSRVDDQGPAFKRCTITLGGFVEGNNFMEVMSLYMALRDVIGVEDLVNLTVMDGAEVIHENQPVYVASYNEPEDREHGKTGVGDYSIELYYFVDNTDNLQISCTYGGYAFEKTPKWGRNIRPNREHYREGMKGSTATIGLSGFLFAEDHGQLMAKIEALQTAFQEDRVLVYGTFEQAVRVVECRIEDTVVRQYAFFQISLIYDIGTYLFLKRSVRIDRIHQNPVITEEPFCDRRLIELMGRSGQSITYNFIVESGLSLAHARNQLTVEATNTIEPGGIEMPGGTETWEPDKFQVNLTVTKFYANPPIPNLSGTGT